MRKIFLAAFIVNSVTARCLRGDGPVAGKLNVSLVYI